MVEITMGGWGNSPIYRVIITFCFYCVPHHSTVIAIQGNLFGVLFNG